MLRQDIMHPLSCSFQNMAFSCLRGNQTITGKTCQLPITILEPFTVIILSAVYFQEKKAWTIENPKDGDTVEVSGLISRKPGLEHFIHEDNNKDMRDI